jgi:hypothetical protein
MLAYTCRLANRVANPAPLGSRLGDALGTTHFVLSSGMEPGSGSRRSLIRFR